MNDGNLVYSFLILNISFFYFSCYLRFLSFLRYFLSDDDRYLYFVPHTETCNVSALNELLVNTLHQVTQVFFYFTNGY